jgi:hypothetical protein
LAGRCFSDDRSGRFGDAGALPGSSGGAGLDGQAREAPFEHAVDQPGGVPAVCV